MPGCLCRAPLANDTRRNSSWLGGLWAPCVSSEEIWGRGVFPLPCLPSQGGLSGFPDWHWVCSQDLMPSWRSLPWTHCWQNRGRGQPLERGQYSCLENSMDRGAWWVTIHRISRVRHDWTTVTYCLHYLSSPKNPKHWVVAPKYSRCTEWVLERLIDFIKVTQLIRFKAKI